MTTNTPRALIGCESSGVIRSRLRAMGINAWSCDLLPADDGSEFHIQGDLLDVLRRGKWDMGIFHPPCTYLTVSGLHWNKRVPGRAAKTLEALGFVRALMAAPIPLIAIENPVSCISTTIRKPDQIVQPYEFGDDASKRTCLWLKGLPKLVIDPAKRCPGRWVDQRGQWVERWSNQTDSGQNRLAPSADRWKLRSATYEGLADAIAEQWGSLLLRSFNHNKQKAA
jgi:hypothetical protein